MTVKALGNKHNCSKCGARFYDLGAEKITCPKCGHVVTAKKAKTPKKVAAPKPVKKAPAPRIIEEVEDFPELDTGVDVEELEELEDDVEDVEAIEEVEEHHEDADIDPNGDDAEDEMYLDDRLGSELLDDVEDYLDADEEEEGDDGK